MKKQVVDIFYPKEAEKKNEEEPEKKKEKLEKTEKEEEFVIKKPKFQIPPIAFEKKLLILGGGFLILAFIFSFFYLSKATIEIWPETEALILKTKLTVDKSAEKADFLTKVIPGEILEKEKTLTENFPASGKILKEGRAEGMIRVYNAYSTLSQVLIVNTRFVSSDGKVFRTPAKITIPGGHYEKGKLIPGETEIKVAADQPGSEYNIGPSVFSIPGFAGTDKYTKFYAKSFEQFTGGFSQEASQVTKGDLEKAKETLTEKAKEELAASLMEELQSEKFSDRIFLEKAIQTEIIDTLALARVGDSRENFNYQVKVKSKTLIFPKEDLKNFSKDFILSQVPEGKKLYEESLKIDFVPETINLNTNKIILSMEISAKIYSNIDLTNLMEGIKEKSAAETKLFLESQTGVKKAEVNFWPFWVRKIPKNAEKIEILVRVD